MGLDALVPKGGSAEALRIRFFRWDSSRAKPGFFSSFSFIMQNTLLSTDSLIFNITWMKYLSFLDIFVSRLDVDSSLELSDNSLTSFECFYACLVNNLQFILIDKYQLFTSIYEKTWYRTGEMFPMWHVWQNCSTWRKSFKNRGTCGDIGKIPLVFSIEVSDWWSSSAISDSFKVALLSVSSLCSVSCLSGKLSKSCIAE